MPSLRLSATNALRFFLTGCAFFSFVGLDVFVLVLTFDVVEPVLRGLTAVVPSADLPLTDAFSFFGVASSAAALELARFLVADFVADAGWRTKPSSVGGFELAALADERAMLSEEESDESSSPRSVTRS